MTARPSPRSLLTADSRRSLALLAGGDLDPTAAPAAQTLADDCPDCRGHLASVRGGLEALRQAEPAEQPGGLWASVRDGLTVAEPAVAPAPSRPWMPIFAVTAATLLVGLFAFGPTAGEVLPGLFESQGYARPAADDGDPGVLTRPAHEVRIRKTAGRSS